MFISVTESFYVISMFENIFSELREMIADVKAIVPDVTLKLCSVLPRKQSAYKDNIWNRYILINSL